MAPSHNPSRSSGASAIRGFPCGSPSGCGASTIGTLQLFDEVSNITTGGPSDSTLTLSLYIYNLTFRFMPSFGYAATVSYVIVTLVAILAFVQFYVARERE